MNENNELDLLRKENEELRNRLYQEQKDRERIIKERIQEKCDHVWGPENWVHACCYICTCEKCGKTEMFYERD